MPLAILIIKIENEASLMMNEFFDYNGVCWALSKSCPERKKECIDLEDFYECTMRSQTVDDVPVVFVTEDSDTSGTSEISDTSEKSDTSGISGTSAAYQIIGWYRHAKIFRMLQIISPFLEGNICAKTLDVRLLSGADRIPVKNFQFKDRRYQVLEDDDERCIELHKIIAQEHRHFIDIRFSVVVSQYQGDMVRMAGLGGDKSIKPVRKMRDFCIEKAGEIAGKVMNDQYSDIRMLKTMYQYGAEAVKYDSRSVDGLYYHAMACEQLGFIKEGFKSIDKALKLEPDGDDLIALKGHLLFALGKYEMAVSLYEEAYAIAPVDGYLMCIGQAWFAVGNVDKAYKTYEKVKDKKILDDYGINLKDMEKRWPFVSLRGFSLKDLISKKTK